MRRSAPNWLTLFSALLIVVAFPPWGWMPLIWVCLIPWFFALRRTQSAMEALIQGMWLSFFMTLGGFFWVAFVLKQFGGLPWIVAILGLLAFGFVGQPQFLVF